MLAELIILNEILTRVISLERHVARIEHFVRREVRELSQLDDKIAALQTQVANETTVDQSAIALLNGIPQLIADAVNNALSQGATPAQLQAMTDLGTTIGNNASGLAAAVTANTPPPPPPVP